MREFLFAELEVYRVTQLYRCTRRAAIVELDLEEDLAPVDPWAVLIHHEFQHAVNKAVSRRT